jgi:hypothetical protein
MNLLWNLSKSDETRYQECGCNNFKRLIVKFTSSSASKVRHFYDAAPCANPTWRISEKNKRVRYQLDSSDQTLSEIPLSGQDSTIPKFTTQNRNEYGIHNPEIAAPSSNMTATTASQSSLMNLGQIVWNGRRKHGGVRYVQPMGTL